MHDVMHRIYWRSQQVMVQYSKLYDFNSAIITPNQHSCHITIIQTYATICYIFPAHVTCIKSHVIWCDMRQTGVSAIDRKRNSNTRKNNLVKHILSVIVYRNVKALIALMYKPPVLKPAFKGHFWEAWPNFNVLTLTLPWVRFKCTMVKRHLQIIHFLLWIKQNSPKNIWNTKY